MVLRRFSEACRLSPDGYSTVVASLVQFLTAGDWKAKSLKISALIYQESELRAMGGGGVVEEPWRAAKYKCPPEAFLLTQWLTKV